MATTSALIDRVRLEIGDQASSFDLAFKSDGVSVRYETGQFPVDGAQLEVWVDDVVQADADVAVEERTGALLFTTAPAADVFIRVRGLKYRYFGGTDIATFVGDAAAQHLYNRVDAYSRSITLYTMPVIEEYPLALLAATLCLFALATDSSFDIDISAPDGVHIPRSERYRQLMEMVATRQQQYRELCAALNIGLERIEVFNFRRVSRTTNRLIPLYVPQEIDDRSFPQRVYLPPNLLGLIAVPLSHEVDDLTITQGVDGGRAWSVTDSDGAAVDLTGYTVKCEVRTSKDQLSSLLWRPRVAIVGGAVMLEWSSLESDSWMWTRGVYDVKLINAGGEVELIVAEGVVVVLKTVTHA
jgi:hypothetical protein